MLLAGLVLSAAVGSGSTQAGSESTQPSGSDLEVTVALTEEIAQIDPHRVSAGPAKVAGNVVEALVDLDPQSGELLPKLATSWELVDPTTWRFELREGVTFSNGEPFNAEAAAWGIMRAVNPDLEVTGDLRAVLSLEDVSAEAVDEYTLEVTTSTPAPSLPREMYLIRLPAPEATGDEPTNNLVGTGPYAVEEFVPSERVVLTRNESYWGETPEVSKGTFVFRTESGVRRAMLDTGEADLAPLNPIDVEGIDTVHTTVSQVIILLPDLTCPAMGDIRVREAMNVAIDREGLAEELYGGLVEPASQIIIPQVPGHADSLEPPPYDPDTASDLISQAQADGVPVDQELRLVTRPGYFLNSDELTELVAAQLNEIGLNVTIQSVEHAQYGPLILEPTVPPERCMVFVVTPINRAFDPASTFQAYYRSEAPLSRLDDPQVDAMIADASAVADEEQRSAAFSDLIENVTEEFVPIVPLLYWADVFGLAPDITFQPRIDGVIQLALIHSK